MALKSTKYVSWLTAPPPPKGRLLLFICLKGSPVNNLEFGTIMGAEKECAVKLLVLGLVPIMLLSLLMVRQSIIYVAIGIPVLILWVLSAIVALIPDGLSSDSGK
jgi:hypothetical protein